MFALEGRRPTSPPCSRTTGSVAPHHEGNSFRAFALNAPFRAVTIIGLANVSSRVLEYLSANPGLFLWMRSCSFGRGSYPAAAYVSSQSTLASSSFHQRAISRSFPRALVSKTVVSAPRNDYFKQPRQPGNTKWVLT